MSWPILLNTKTKKIAYTSLAPMKKWVFCCWLFLGEGVNCPQTLRFQYVCSLFPLLVTLMANLMDALEELSPREHLSLVSDLFNLQQLKYLNLIIYWQSCYVTTTLVCFRGFRLMYKPCKFKELIVEWWMIELIISRYLAFLPSATLKQVYLKKCTH